MATISDMREALADVRARFRALKRMCWLQGPIVRSTLFAETWVESDGERLLIGVPLSSRSLRRVERFIPLKRHLMSAEVPQLKILREEILCQRGEYSDILCEVLPEGLPFADAMASLSGRDEAEALLEALDALQRQLERADVSHNNVAEKNLVIDSQGRLHLIRWYYATQRAGEDRAAFDELRNSIMSNLEEGLMREPSRALYDVLPKLDGHLTVRPMREGLAAVEDNSGWGFVDSENRTVVPARYLWVNDFYEGRAEVETEEGMGLIDRLGEYVIEPRYRIVEYDPRSGCSKALCGQEWIEFDYSGRRIGEDGQPEQKGCEVSLETV